MIWPTSNLNYEKLLVFEKALQTYIKKPKAEICIGQLFSLERIENIDHLQEIMSKRKSREA